jgi:flagellar hook-basal body complex protein FliE
MDFKGDFPELKETSSDKSFSDFLTESISKVNTLQQDADVAMQRLASGESKNLHETLLAVERADIAFKQMNQVRLKVIDAYKEIMRMQV